MLWKKTQHPTNLKSLIAYLAPNPYLLLSLGNGSSEPRRFLRFERGKFWFTRVKDDHPFFFSISGETDLCEGGVEFDAVGFVLSKQGLIQRYAYAKKGEA